MLLTQVQASPLHPSLKSLRKQPVQKQSPKKQSQKKQSQRKLHLVQVPALGQEVTVIVIVVVVEDVSNPIKLAVFLIFLTLMMTIKSVCLNSTVPSQSWI
jgi:hypothetical protein